MINKFKYYAFISYSRTDKLVANYLKNNLEKFPYPKDLVSEENRPLDDKYIAPIFLDRDKLETTSDSFTAELHETLRSSKYLILLASRASASSHWCNEELKVFLEANGNDFSKVLPVMIEGASLTEISTPTMLEHIDKFSVRNLPDMRSSPTDSVAQAWEHGLTQIISYVLGISKTIVSSVIEKEAKTQNMRKILIIVLPILAAILLFLLYTCESSPEPSEEKAMTIDASTKFGKSSSLHSLGSSGLAEASGNGNQAEPAASQEEGGDVSGDAGTDSTSSTGANDAGDGANVDLSQVQQADSSAVGDPNAAPAPADTKQVDSVGGVLRAYSLKMPDGSDLQLVELSTGNFIAGGYPVWDKVNASIDKAFSLSRLEISQAQYKSLEPDSSSIFPAKEDLPMENVSWEQAMGYCAKLTDYFRSTKQIADNEIVTLPTEFQWEYAAKCDSPANEDVRAWNVKNSDYSPHGVGEKEANLWGIYDMNGNVSEWCRDSYGINGASSINAQQESDFKTIKGGSYATNFIVASERDSFNKSGKSHQIGFRIVIEKKE